MLSKKFQKNALYEINTNIDVSSFLWTYQLEIPKEFVCITKGLMKVPSFISNRLIMAKLKAIQM